MVQKKVGFAPDPVELKEHHEHLKQIEEEERKSNPFHKLPPELQYLDKSDKSPKPLPTNKPKIIRKQKELGDLKKCHVKDISVINKDTEINFNYPTIELPISSYNLLVKVEYCSLNSFDISKINKYYYNLSDTNVGLGYEFSGTIVDIGSKVKNGLNKGDKVFGSINPNSRKGSLSTTLLLNPTKDFIVKITDEDFEKIQLINPLFPTKSDNEIVLPTLAKFSLIPVLYCKSKQALQHLKNYSVTNILINGADTNLGYLLIQILNSSNYNFQHLKLTLIVEDNNVEIMEDFVENFKASNKSFDIIEFNYNDEDLVKKPDLMAINVFEAMFKNTTETITQANINDYKFDLIIDIIGSNWLTKTSIKYKKLDYLKLPTTFEPQLSNLLNSTVKDQFFVKILKPKSLKSSFISFCKYGLNHSTYSIDKLIDYSTQSNEQLNPWSNSWTLNIANSFIKYNYYDEINLTIKESWIKEGLELLLNEEIKFKIDASIDWRENFKQHYKKLRNYDGKIVLKLEEF